jgi:chemotaxis protein MotB
MAENAPAGGGKERPIIIIRKKRKGHAAHHGGAWKVAYADFVTAMMAFFLVMWLLTQADLKLRSQVAQYFRDPGILAGGAVINPEANTARSNDPKALDDELMVVQGTAGDILRTGPMKKDEGQAGLLGRGPEEALAQAEEVALEEQASAVQAEIAKATSENPELSQFKDQVIVQVTDSGLSIQVVDKGRQLLFDLSSAELKPQLVEILKRVAGVLGKLPNPVQIGGHTDSRPFANDRAMSNWDLAFQRANNARKVMDTGGLRPRQISRVVSYADTAPLVPDNPLADENRRLSVLAERQHAAPTEFDDRDHSSMRPAATRGTGH